MPRPFEVWVENRLLPAFYRENLSATYRGTPKRWQTSTNSGNYNFYMFALLEIARIYKALKRFADLQGPICYNDAQNKEINRIVYYI